MTVSVPIAGPLASATFVDRPNRFVLRARTDLQHEEVDAHLPDPGRLADLLLPGARVWLRVEPEAGRRTQHLAVLVAAPSGALVSLDPSLPKRLVAEALRASALEELSGFDLESTDVPWGPSRLDFALRDVAGNRVLVAVESVSWARDGVGRVPDAPTDRGVRNLRHLVDIAHQPGLGAALVLVAPRSDVNAIEPAAEVDPAFAEGLSEAVRGGVRIIGRRCQLTLEELMLGIPVPVRALDRRPGPVGAG